MVSTPSREMLARLPGYQPSYLRWGPACSAARFRLSSTSEPTALGQCLKAVRINGLTALTRLTPNLDGRAKALSLAAGGWAFGGWPVVPLAQTVLPPPLAFAVRAPLGVLQAVHTLVLYGALLVLGGTWGTGPKPFWAHGLLGLPHLGLGLLAQALASRHWHGLSAVMVGAAAGAALPSLGLRVASDVAHALCAVPLAAAAFGLGLVVDWSLIVYNRLQGLSATTERYLFAPCLPRQGPLLNMQKGSDGSVRRGVVGAYAPFEGAPNEDGVAWDETAFAPVGPTLAEAHAAALLRAKCLDQQVEVFFDLVAKLTVDPIAQRVVAQEVDFESFADHIIDMLRLADTPEARQLFNNRPNVSRYALPKVEREKRAWLRRLNTLFVDPEIMRGYYDAEMHNTKLHELRAIFNIAGPDDDRLKFVSKKMMTCPTPQEFMEARAQRSRQEARARARARAQEAAAFDFPNAKLKQLTKGLDDMRPLLGSCLDHMKRGAMWPFFKHLMALDAKEDARAQRLRDINGLTSDLSALQRPGSSNHEGGGRAAAMMWRNLEKQWAEPPKQKMTLLKRLQFCTSPDQIYRLVIARPKTAAQATGTAEGDQDRLVVSLKDWSHALFTLSTNLEQAAMVFASEDAHVPLRRCSSL